MTWEFFPPVISIILWFSYIFPSYLCLSFRSRIGTVLEQTSSAVGQNLWCCEQYIIKSFQKLNNLSLKCSNVNWTFSYLIVCVFFLQFPLDSCTKTSCPNDNCTPKSFKADLYVFLCQYCPFTWLHFFHPIFYPKIYMNAIITSFSLERLTKKL